MLGNAKSLTRRNQKMCGRMAGRGGDGESVVLDQASSDARCDVRKMTRKTLVLGLGNTLLGDEGVGVHAVRWMQQQHGGRSDIEFLDGGTLSFTLAGPIEEADNLIVVDAAELHAAPGTLRVFVGGEMDRFLGTNRKASVHEVSLLDLMTIALLAGRLPRYRALVGIQPQFLDWADCPSDAVARAIPQACGEVIGLAGAWQ